MDNKILKIITAIAVVVVVGFGIYSGFGTVTEKLGMTNYMPVQLVMDSVTATSTGKFTLSQSYKNVVYSIDTSATTTATLNFIGSINETAPSSTVARSVTNQFEYLQILDLENGTSIDGDTGVTLSGDDHRLVEIQTNLINWVAPDLTSYATGTIDVQIVAGDNR